MRSSNGHCLVGHLVVMIMIMIMLMDMGRYYLEQV